jgi:hypothetical protein
MRFFVEVGASTKATENGYGRFVAGFPDQMRFPGLAFGGCRRSRGRRSRLNMGGRFFSKSFNSSVDLQREGILQTCGVAQEWMQRKCEHRKVRKDCKLCDENRETEVLARKFQSSCESRHVPSSATSSHHPIMRMDSFPLSGHVKHTNSFFVADNI